MKEIFDSIKAVVESIISKITDLFSNFMHDNRKRRLLIIILAAIIIILVIIFVIVSRIQSKRNLACQDLREKIILKADEYAERKSLYPTLNGEQVIVSLRDLDEIVFEDNYVNGTVTYTKYNDSYIKTVDISNAEFCNTKEFGKETNEYKENKNVKVNVTFNYRNVDSYSSKWSNYIPSDEISTEATDGVYLPIDSKDLPSIPSGAVITGYETETLTYYSYRDKQWKWYKNNIKYSDYSSTQPDGYTYKDEATKSKTEATEWSIDYPEVFEYRHISEKTGYRWFYMDGKEKVYWENGKYSVDSPGDEYEKDKDAKAKMYSYYDDIWRWYNGSTKRSYSGYYSTKPSNYNYKDDSTLRYTSWSSYSPTSRLTSENSSYREERTDIHTRFLIKYDIYSFEKLNNNVSQEDLEKIIGQSYEEINNNKKIKVEVYFTFQYE